MYTIILIIIILLYFANYKEGFWSQQTLTEFKNYSNNRQIFLNYLVNSLFNVY